jgi:hypothetical protein
LKKQRLVLYWKDMWNLENTFLVLLLLSQNPCFYHIAVLHVRGLLLFYYQDGIYTPLNNFSQNSCSLVDQIIKQGFLWKINVLELLFALEELHHLLFFQKISQNQLRNLKTLNILSFFYFHKVSLNIFSNSLNIFSCFLTAYNNLQKFNGENYGNF